MTFKSKLLLNSALFSWLMVVASWFFGHPKFVILIEPKEGMRICDPTCGSGGMLIVSRRHVENHGGDPRNPFLTARNQTMGTWQCAG